MPIPNIAGSEPSAASRRAARFLLVAILGFALWTRERQSLLLFPELYHIDEPIVVLRALHMVETGDPNPRWFWYGSLVLYAQAVPLAAELARLERLAPDDPDFLRSPADLQYAGAPGDPLRRAPPGTPGWWISHPTLFLAARQVSVAAGVAAVALAWAIGGRLGGPFAACAAALLLAADGMHTRHSGWATVDATAATLALAAVLLTLRFVDCRKGRDLMAALAFVGLAAGAKYSLGVVGLAPLLAVVAGWRTPSTPRWIQALALIVVPSLAFAISTPYALVERGSFLAGLRWQYDAYIAAPERASMTSTPGLAHAGELLATLASDLGALGAVAATVGLFLSVLGLRGAITFLPGIALLASIAATSGPFQRNVLLLYPLASIASALALAALWRRRRALQRRGARWTLLAFATGAALALLLAPLATAARRAWRQAGFSTSTSDLVPLLARLRAARPVEIAAELGVPRPTVDRIGEPVAVRPLADLACQPTAGALVVTPLALVAIDELSAPAARRLTLLLDLAPPPLAIAGSAPLTLDRPRPKDLGLSVRESWPPTEGLAELCAGEGSATAPVATPSGLREESFRTILASDREGCPRRTCSDDGAAD